MSGPEPDQSGDPERAARLRSMGRILHEAGKDEELEFAPPTTGQDAGDALLRREVPPHHGG